MRSLKTLLAGPWVGEFGWELFGWQSYLRSLSKQFSHVIISSRTSSRYLYHDFCNEFISFESSFENTNYHTNKNIVSDPLSILRCDKRIMSNKLSGDQEFIEYGTKQKDYLFDVVIHARNLKTKTKRNWDIQKWNKIAQECDKKNYKVCCVGLSDYTHLVHPFIDKRDHKDKDGKYIGFKNGLYLNKEVSKKDTWNTDDIKSRTNLLINDALQLFRFDNEKYKEN